MASTRDDHPDLGDLLPRAYRYALALTHNSAEASDLVQEACLAVIQAGGSWNRAYLFTAIRSRFLNHKRRAKVVLIQPVEDLDHLEGEVTPELLGDSEAMLLESEELEAALATLNPDHRESLFLAAVEGYTAQEIADLTDRPRGTILSWIHRARQQLRKILSPKGIAQV